MQRTSQEFVPTPRQADFIQNVLFVRGFLDLFTQKFNEWCETNNLQVDDQFEPTEEQIAEDAAQFVMDLWLATPKETSDLIDQEGINMFELYVWLYRTYLQNLKKSFGLGNIKNR